MGGWVGGRRTIFKAGSIPIGSLRQAAKTASHPPPPSTGVVGLGVEEEEEEEEEEEKEFIHKLGREVGGWVGGWVGDVRSSGRVPCP